MRFVFFLLTFVFTSELQIDGGSAASCCNHSAEGGSSGSPGSIYWMW